jgi:ABC-2 type transport system ATP-binding protein
MRLSRMSLHVSAVDVSVSSSGEQLLASTSFELDCSRALAIVGANGSGKTTLLRVLSGLITPTTGTVRIAGSQPDERDPRFRSSVAALIGLPPFARNLTLVEHMALVGASWGSTVARAKAHSNELLEEFSMSHLGSRFPHELSSGQTQLFSLALTLSRPFDILLLDEPEQRLDSYHVELVGNTIRRFVENGNSVVMVSHNRSLVDRVSDQTLELT